MKSTLSALLACLLCTLGAATAQDINPLTIHTNDGLKLAARHFAPKTSGNGILLLNMCDPQADMTHWDGVAAKLQDKGFHVLTFDYRGFGESEGEKLKGTSQAEVIQIWRDEWLTDVEAAYSLLASQSGVTSEAIGVAGASCGTFLGLEFILTHPNVKAFASLGGPVDDSLISRLEKNKTTIPMLLIGASEGLTLDWSDRVFNVSQNQRTQLTKYKFVKHGTDILFEVPEVENQIADWFELYLNHPKK
ncbi:MAG: hypothetical protein DHS20C05_04420 [Hyphococcus sp.]|nr:MAG: hypothetical protein DHS20C05_04420 [Marinicaulis sp.]